ncbi:glutamine amidotransferase [Sphingomonas sp. LaA6.9]|uniref:glutamine amidotransferase n=1 Tax=Sphingomonas sp. LaA6.9 TaxID=2919914 RepID=UPI001F4FC59D|nr:glutamine amidotransferase [Sphingomonas sp. LaA6.9]MCJ8157109.1 glutamine amidotransferase [Sphingomonas sp. LaA6.9]
MPKRALIVRHVPYEGIAGFRDPIESAGYQIERLDVANPDFHEADLVSPDLVILMGGPMGVYDDHRYPWIAHEIERLRARLMLDRPTIGVCLGAQMIAAALGARVYRGAAKEIGFHRLTLNADGLASPLAHLADQPVLQWHGDTFDLPAGAALLASTPQYPHQAFRCGRRVLALQCHAEMGLDPRIEAWIDQSHDSLAEVGIEPETLRAQYAAIGPAAVEAGQKMIRQWLCSLD